MAQNHQGECLFKGAPGIPKKEMHSMKMVEVKQKAKGMGLKVGKAKKEELIKTIQLSEGNSPCFGTTDGSCDRADCLWRADCIS